MLSAPRRCWRMPEAGRLWGGALCQYCGGLPVWILRQRVPHDPERPLWGWVSCECSARMTVTCRVGRYLAWFLFPSTLHAWHQFIQALSASWIHRLFASSFQWLFWDYFPSSCSHYFSPQYLPFWYLEWNHHRMINCIMFSTNPDLITESGPFIWEHGAGVTSVDFLFLTFSPTHIPLSPLLSFTCVLGLSHRLPKKHGLTNFGQIPTVLDKISSLLTIAMSFLSL